MSAKDDADTTPTAAPRRHLASTIALAVVAGAALGALVALVVIPRDVAFFESRMTWLGATPGAQEWPDAVQPGESARVERGPDGAVLVVRAARAPRARALAASLMARRTAGLRQLFAAGDTLAARWGTGIPEAPRGTLLVAARPGDAPPAALDSSLGIAAPAWRRLSLPNAGPDARCAALLMGRARYRRDVVRAVPAPWATTQRVELPQPDAAMLDHLRELAVAVDRRDPVAVADAMVAGARAEDDWFAGASHGRDASLHARAQAWRAWQLAQADSADAMASRVLHAAPGVQQLLAARIRDRVLVDLALRLPRPYDALVRSFAPAWAPLAVPIAAAWQRWLGGGALLGALAALLLSALALLLARPARRHATMFVPARDPGAGEAWLHLVTGPSPAAIARGVIEVAAHALSRGDRVLVIDGGSRLKLHERFGREARWGLMECLLADMPVIGLVQYGGRPGFYLLAYGNRSRTEGWAAVGQRLDDVRPHFGRIVLAMDPGTPRIVGDALAGRQMEGWWAEAVRTLPRAAVEFSERIGIALAGIDLSVVPQASLEALSGRALALTLFHPETVEPDAVPPEAAVPEPAGVSPSEPLVLDCDLQMRQRLRFLAWMRRVQSERRGVEAESVL